MSFNPGETVGPYRIIEQLGQGGMATVYKAYHASLDRYVALKVLHPAFLEDPNFLARFQREARLVAKLEHPNIVPIYDYAEHEGRPYLVMKFIEGETLKARLAGSPIEANEVERVVEAVGVGLGYAHKHGVLHRDIKPSNVLLANDGQIYLADFGLARIAQSGESTLTSDMVLGTPQYISPEQAIGQKNLDEGTDIYSFGVMLYELVVGRVPFSADTPFSIIHDHIYTPLPMPSNVNPDVSEQIERVLLKALAKDRHDRYKDVSSLVEAFLQAWRESRPVVPVQVEMQKVEPEVPAVPVPPVAPLEQPPTVPAEKLVPAAVSLVPAGAEAEVAPLTAATLPPIGAAPVKPRKFPWMWIAVLVLLLLCCIVTVYALRGRKAAGIIPKIPTIMPTSVPTMTNLPAPTLEGIAALEQYVKDNPSDPHGYLNLALALIDEGKEERLQEQVDNLERTAGDKEDFMWRACDQFSAKKAWLTAARMCVRAAEIQTQAGQLPNDLRNKMHEAVYKACIDKRFPDYLPTDRISMVDEPLARLCKARFSFYIGVRAEAQAILDELKQQKPDMPEADLFQAEIYLSTDRGQDARPILDALLQKADLPSWISLEAEALLSQIP